MINGDRIRLARELRGLTQTELAELVNITQPTIAQIEKGVISPSDNTLQAIILRTGFPLSFFKQPTSIEFPAGSSLLNRARASMTLRERNVARQYARVVFEVAEKLEKSFKEIPVHLLPLDDDAISAAMQTRSFLGFSPDSPIDNLINAIEDNGIMVIALPVKLRDQDAFSMWVRGKARRPLIILSGASESGDRLRFSVAHEIGHLVIHKGTILSMKELEDEADEFAGEFLMPREAMLKEITVPVTLPTLLPLKKRWKVSLQALIRRAYELGVISQRQYKYLMQQVSARGWRTKEPIDIPKEKPRKISQMAENIYGFPIDYRSLASDMNLTSQMMKEIIETHGSKTNGQVSLKKSVTVLKPGIVDSTGK